MISGIGVPISAAYTYKKEQMIVPYRTIKKSLDSYILRKNTLICSFKDKTDQSTKILALIGGRKMIQRSALNIQGDYTNHYILDVHHLHG